MLLEILQQPWLLWSFGLMVGFPLLMLLISENILRAQARKSSVVEPLQIIRNLILPSLAIYIALTQILGFNPDNSLIRLLQSLLLLATIHLSLSIANIIFFVGAGAGTWQANVPKLLRDLVRFFLILIGTAVVLSLVWKLDLGNLITALGVSSIVIGLALQDTLGNLFSGITLLFGRPFRLGHWIEVGDIVGKVAEINWRAVHLTTREQEMLVVPNSVLAKEIFRNFSQPIKQHVEVIDLGFSYDHPPNLVKQILLETALATKGVQKTPVPIVQTIHYNDFSIDYRVKIFISDYGKLPTIRDDFMTRIWYAAKRHHLEIPFPIRTVYHQSLETFGEEDSTADLLPQLQRLPIFAKLTAMELAELTNKSIRKVYGTSEPIIELNSSNTHLHLVLNGQVEIFCQSRAGTIHPISRLSHGEFFGTMALLNSEPSLVGVKALSDVEVLVFDTEVVNVVVAKSPILAQVLGNIIEVRRKDLDKVALNE